MATPHEPTDQPLDEAIEASLNRAVTKEVRITWVIQLFTRCRSYGDQLIAVSQEFGIGYRMAAKYLKWANERLRARAIRNREEKIAAYVNVLDQTIYNPLESTKDRTAAIKVAAQLDNLMPAKELKIISPYDGLTPDELAATAKKLGLDEKPLELPQEGDSNGESGTACADITPPT